MASGWHKRAASLTVPALSFRSPPTKVTPTTDTTLKLSSAPLTSPAASPEAYPSAICVSWCRSSALSLASCSPLKPSSSSPLSGALLPGGGIAGGGGSGGSPGGGGGVPGNGGSDGTSVKGGGGGGKARRPSMSSAGGEGGAAGVGAAGALPTSKRRWTSRVYTWLTLASASAVRTVGVCTWIQYVRHIRLMHNAKCCVSYGGYRDRGVLPCMHVLINRTHTTMRCLQRHCHDSVARVE